MPSRIDSALEALARHYLLQVAGLRWHCKMRGYYERGLAYERKKADEEWYMQAVLSSLPWFV